MAQRQVLHADLPPGQAPQSVPHGWAGSALHLMDLPFRNVPQPAAIITTACYDLFPTGGSFFPTSDTRVAPVTSGMGGAAQHPLQPPEGKGQGKGSSLRREHARGWNWACLPTGRMLTRRGPVLERSMCTNPSEGGKF